MTPPDAESLALEIVEVKGYACEEERDDWTEVWAKKLRAFERAALRRGFVEGMFWPKDVAPGEAAEAEALRRYPEPTGEGTR